MLSKEHCQENKSSHSCVPGLLMFILYVHKKETCYAHFIPQINSQLKSNGSKRLKSWTLSNFRHSYFIHWILSMINCIIHTISTVFSLSGILSDLLHIEQNTKPFFFPIFLTSRSWKYRARNAMDEKHSILVSLPKAQHFKDKKRGHAEVQPEPDVRHLSNRQVPSVESRIKDHLQERPVRGRSHGC